MGMCWLAAWAWGGEWEVECGGEREWARARAWACGGDTSLAPAEQATTPTPPQPSTAPHTKAVPVSVSTDVSRQPAKTLTTAPTLAPTTLPPTPHAPPAPAPAPSTDPSRRSREPFCFSESSTLWVE